jgi:hypothetical protein
LDGFGSGGKGFSLQEDPTRLKVFLEKHIKFLLLQGHEQIDLTALGGGVCYKFNGVVPWFGIRQVIEGVLGED